MVLAAFESDLQNMLLQFFFTSIPLFVNLSQPRAAKNYFEKNLKAKNHLIMREKKLLKKYYKMQNDEMNDQGWLRR